MLRRETQEQSRFRARIRDWLETNLPAELRHLTFRPEPSVAMWWHRKLHEGGWVAPHWPRQHGGMDATPVEQLILCEEMARIGAPDIPLQGLLHIGPLLIKFGTEEQKARHLPKILRGEVTWAQGYSEPDAGSDLGALRTRGRIEGEEIVLTGHKTWTTWGQSADWMFGLVRTDPSSKKRDGITFVMFPLSLPGVTRRPIANLAAEVEFCEVFLDEVRVPLANVVGHAGHGWSVAMALLDEERIRGGAPLLALKALERARAILRFNQLCKNPGARERMAQAEVEVATLCAAYLDSMEKMTRGMTDGRDSSYLKILATETTQFVLDVANELAGYMGGVCRPARDASGRVDFTEMFLQSRRLTIYGGSNEVQRGLLAARALGLPRGGR